MVKFRSQQSNNHRKFTDKWRTSIEDDARLKVLKITDMGWKGESNTSMHFPEWDSRFFEEGGVRKVWKGYQMIYMESQTIQCHSSKEKGQNTTWKNNKSLSNTNPTKSGNNLWCSGQITSSCSTINLHGGKCWLLQENEDEQNVFQYGPMRGDPDFLQELAIFLSTEYGDQVDR